MPRESDFRDNRLDLESYQSTPTSASIPRMHRPYSKTSGYQQNEQFLRSASARLPRNKDDDGTARDGEKKREESMKRLLEWKQRMLQSPLTRKGIPLTIAMDTKLQNSMSTGIQRSRSETHANAGYNSYSSDDEGKFSFVILVFINYYLLINSITKQNSEIN